MEINGIERNESVRYEELHLSDEVMQALGKKGFEVATPIQAGCVPFLMDWKDIVAKAPTGTGKTFAFGIPVVEHTDPAQTAVTTLILAPTRELALQIRDDLRELSQFKPGIRVTCLYGGQPIEKQLKQLKEQPQIVVATPGRLMDCKKRKAVRPDKVETVILDEADRMLDMGFIEDVTKILDMMPQRKNLGLFSATISREVMDISWVYQRNPAEVTVRPVAEDRPDIQQYLVKLDNREEKLSTMAALLEGGGYERGIAFCNTKNMADRLAAMAKMQGIDAEAIHGNIQQKQREKTLQKFRDGKLRLLVATDVAARGLDIDDVDVVFNYDVPDEQEYYIHRIGRTGRARKHGVSYTFVSTITDAVKMDQIQKNQRFDIQKLEFDEDGCLNLVDRAQARQEKIRKNC
ncbi:MAG: DEAD/DEAH box helicase [Clostridiales bacterium]|nr:DEAD/DEAH box helicase [Clostridiales bacterium]